MAKQKLQETNVYTLLFALFMSALVAGGLAYLKKAWGPLQKENELLFSKNQILGSVMEVTPDTDVDQIFKERVEGKLIDNNGKVTSEKVEEALNINLYKESKVKPEKRRFPVYTYKAEDGKIKYIVPTVGLGLWDQIKAYVALEEDKNTIAGIVFDHVAETPGLGAKIKDDAGFYTDFIGEKIFNKSGELVGVTVFKGNGDPANVNKDDHKIDAISGATITGDGVTDMLKNELTLYKPFLTSKK